VEKIAKYRLSRPKEDLSTAGSVFPSTGVPGFNPLPFFTGSCRSMSGRFGTGCQQSDGYIRYIRDKTVFSGVINQKR
jgi:hypothetical protein